MSKFLLGVWCQFVGTKLDAPMTVNPAMSATPELGKFHQGYRAKQIDPCLRASRIGDPILLHCPFGQTILTKPDGTRDPQRYSISDIDTADREAPYLSEMNDFAAAYSDLSNVGVYIGAIARDPVVKSQRSATDVVRVVNGYLARILSPFSTKAFLGIDESAEWGGDDLIGATVTSLLNLHARQRLILAEPWLTSDAIAKRLDPNANVGVLSLTAELARWRMTASRWPTWFPLENQLRRPVWYIINDYPPGWPTLPDVDRVQWAFEKAREIAIRGCVPLVSANLYPRVASVFNSYFGR